MISVQFDVEFIKIAERPPPLRPHWTPPQQPIVSALAVNGLLLSPLAPTIICKVVLEDTGKIPET